jgi:hypothetical protein
MSGPSIEPPVGWRVTILPANGRPFDREFRPKPRRTSIVATLAEAEREKERQRAHYGDYAAICIEPVYVGKQKRQSAHKALQQSLDAAGWPLMPRRLTP